MQIAVRASTGAWREEAVGPLVDELVGVREALAREEHGARVADGDAVAELLADRHERGDVVAGAEEVEVGPRRVRLDEDRARRRSDSTIALSPISSSDRAATSRLRLRGAVAADERLLAEALLARAGRVTRSECRSRTASAIGGTSSGSSA